MTRAEQVEEIQKVLGYLLEQISIIERIDNPDAHSVAQRSLAAVASVVRHEFLTLTNIAALAEERFCNGDNCIYSH